MPITVEPLPPLDDSRTRSPATVNIESLRLAYDIAALYSTVMSGPSGGTYHLSKSERALHDNAVAYLRDTFATLHHQLPKPPTGD